MSIACNDGECKCSCVDKAKQAELAQRYEQQIEALNKTIAEQEKRIADQSEALTNWKDAWHNQRDATGKAYWEGYVNGKTLAIGWHRNQASNQRKLAETYTYPDCKKGAELDATFHDWCSEQVADLGYSSRS